MVNNGRWLKFIVKEQQDPLDKTDYGPEESPFEHNAEILEKEYGKFTLGRTKDKYVPDKVTGKIMSKAFGITPEEYHEREERKYDGLKSADVLDQIKLGNILGKGQFGTVYEIENSSRAIKFFTSSFHMNKDLARFELISNQVFDGSASLRDFHIFEHGKLGDTKLFYVIMPKIVPITQAPFYKLSEIFKDVANQNARAANRFVQGEPPSYEEWKESVFYYLKLEDQWNNYDTQEEFKKYPQTLGRIMEAGYRTYTQFGAKDIHKDNIGYYVQKPDIFFYFDM